MIFSGRLRLRPQSPRAWEEVGVVIAWLVGCAPEVPGADQIFTVAEGGSGGGSDMRREARKSWAPGEHNLAAISFPRGGRRW